MQHHRIIIVIVSLHSIHMQYLVLDMNEPYLKWCHHIKVVGNCNTEYTEAFSAE